MRWSFHFRLHYNCRRLYAFSCGSCTDEESHGGGDQLVPPVQKTGHGCQSLFCSNPRINDPAHLSPHVRIRLYILTPHLTLYTQGAVS
ncbi:hypothetical protein GDO81_022160 [Engystomops pustulosus]|uniref:Uncharacterized protein n=1 Tax=Engystomops pustulosus TaxID=76066 RepID=A0AAV6YRL4_ENGPU|nr:hypothetical protein GDO81_022160 [Engystomops pustulosus]